MDDNNHSQIMTTDLNGNLSVLEATTATQDAPNADLQALKERMNQVQYFICPLLFFIGVSGNTCTILTVSRKQFQHLTSRYILCALAVSDSLLLCTNPFNQEFMKDLWEQDVRALSTFGCKLFFTMYRVGKMTSSWFIVLVATERFLAVLFPLKAKFILQKRNIVISISIVYIVILSFSSVWTFSIGIVDDVCIPDDVNKETVELHKLFVVIAACMHSIVPIVLLLTLTPPIIVTLLRNHQQRQQMYHSAINRSARETSKISLMLIGIVLAYIVWVTPITIVLIMTFWNNQPIFGSTNSNMIIFQSIALIFEQLNHSSNFFIYVMCSYQFRQRFLAMVSCQHPIRNDGVAVSSTSITPVFHTNKDSAQ